MVYTKMIYIYIYPGKTACIYTSSYDLKLPFSIPISGQDMKLWYHEWEIKIITLTFNEEIIA